MVIDNKNRLRWFKAVLFVLLLITSDSYADINKTYKLGYGDMIDIKVFGEDDLTVKTQINDLGIISFPFLGELYILGLTVTEVQNRIIEGLNDGYLVDPKVSVSVAQYRRFYVTGEVRSPGAFAFLPGMTVEKAITLAGGFTVRAARRKITIKSDDEKVTESKSFKQVGLNESVKPGDVVTVGKRFF